MKRISGKGVPKIMIASLLLLTQDPIAQSPTNYMNPARFFAASPVTDTEALGGFASSDHLPTKNTADTPKDFVTLKASQGKVNVIIANRDKKDLWFRAADSNLIMWLEAKDGKVWKPIQYHMWITCGNSYHRVNLPVGYNFAFDTPFQTGTIKTELRLTYFIDRKSDTNPPQNSTSIPVSIDPRAFSLDPEKAASQQISTEWVTPTLMPKR